MTPIIRDSVPRSLALGVGSVTVLALTAIASRIGTERSPSSPLPATLRRFRLRSSAPPMPLRHSRHSPKRRLPRSVANSLASSPQAPAISFSGHSSLSDSSSFCERISCALFSERARLIGMRRALPRPSWPFWPSVSSRRDSRFSFTRALCGAAVLATAFLSNCGRRLSRLSLPSHSFERGYGIAFITRRFLASG